MKEVISVSHLKKSFGKLDVLTDINLKLKRGQNMAIMGRSGIGKSVLIKCIVNLVEPDDGDILVLDKKITNLRDDELDELRKHVGYLFQGGALYDSMTVRENLEFPIRRTDISKRKGEMNDLIEEALENVGLLDAIDKMPAELSGGMKKRVGLARSLILKPEIILYDEPTTGLDPVTSNEISELIITVQEKYKTSSIIVTHDLKCAKMTSNEVKLLRDGVFVAEGSFEELENSEDETVRRYFN